MEVVLHPKKAIQGLLVLLIQVALIKINNQQQSKAPNRVV